MTDSVEMRKEDIGKMLFGNAEKMDIAVVELEAKRFFDEVPATYYLLYSRELNYFTTFEKISDAPAVLFVDFLENSFYKGNDSEFVRLDFVTNIEYNKNIFALELFIKDKYFQVMPWTMEEL